MRLLPLCLMLIASTAVAEDNCLTAPYDTPVTEDQIRLAGILDEALLGRSLLPTSDAGLSDMTATICLTTKLDGAYAYFDVAANRIHLDRALSSAMQVGVLLHELRHLDQVDQGVCPSDRLSMQEYARAVFAMEADASALSLLVAWELRSLGHARAWDALAAWPSQADIATVFRQEMENGSDLRQAVTSAFYQWYASEDRRESYYLSTCAAYLDRQDDLNILPKYELLSEDFLRNLCRLPDGRPYDCTTPEGKAD